MLDSGGVDEAIILKACCADWFGAVFQLLLPKFITRKGWQIGAPCVKSFNIGRYEHVLKSKESLMVPQFFLVDARGWFDLIVRVK